VPELVWPTPFKNNPGITWRSLAGQIRYNTVPTKRFVMNKKPTTKRQRDGGGGSGLTGATPCNFFTIFEPFLGDACQISNAEAWKRVTADPVRGSPGRQG
jgi:hypothetical protein